MQQALLKILEGKTATITPDGARNRPQQELIQIDTTDILFICCGAFNGLEDIVRRRTGQRGLGFGAEVSTAEDDKDALRRQARTEDLIKFGMIPEFMGRLPVIVSCDALDVDALTEVLWKPKNALAKQYHRLFELEGVKLNFRPDALKAIAEEAVAPQLRCARPARDPRGSDARRDVRDPVADRRQGMRRHARGRRAPGPARARARVQGRELVSRPARPHRRGGCSGYARTVAELRNVIVFAIGGVRYAVELRWVREVVSLGFVTAVPTAPAALGGVCNLHGAILPVLDVAALLGQPPGPPARQGDGALVIETEGVVVRAARRSGRSRRVAARDRAARSSTPAGARSRCSIRSELRAPRARADRRRSARCPSARPSMSDTELDFDADELAMLRQLFRDRGAGRARDRDHARARRRLGEADAPRR